MSLSIVMNKLSDVKLKCMEYSDKTVKFGCIVFLYKTYFDTKSQKEILTSPHQCIIDTSHKIDGDYIKDYLQVLQYKIVSVIWNPIDWWYLCYLAEMAKIEMPTFEDYIRVFPEIMKQNILERPDGFCEKYLLPFLQTHGTRH